MMCMPGKHHSDQMMINCLSHLAFEICHEDTIQRHSETQ